MHEYRHGTGFAGICMKYAKTDSGKIGRRVAGFLHPLDPYLPVSKFSTYLSVRSDETWAHTVSHQRHMDHSVS